MGPQGAPIGDWPRKLPENAFCGIEIALNFAVGFFFQNLTSKPHLPRELGVRTESLGANFFLPVSVGSKPKTAVPSSSNGESPVAFCANPYRDPRFPARLGALP